ncbi:MAG: ABC transporter ATP-binding protein/permease [Clostridia bacterium]|nr:ABC transporter ATP-binding protein/permease [Clostridia bacterium]
MDKKLNYFTVIKFLSKYTSKYKRNFIMFYFGWFFDMALSLIMPILFGIMIDEIVYYQNLNTFIKISIMILIMSVFSCALYFLIYAQHHFLKSRYLFDIKKDIFRHLQKCDAQFMTDTSAGDIIATVQSYSSECMLFMSRSITHFINAILSIVAIVVYLFVISWQIGLFILLAAPISVIINAKFGKKIRDYGEKQREYYSGYISWVFEILSALRDIRMLGAQQETNKKFKENHNKMFAVNIKSSVSSITANNIISFTHLFVQLAIFAFVGYSAITGNITIGLLTIIVAFYSILTSKINLTSLSYLETQSRISQIQRVYDFLQSPTEDDWKGKRELIITEGNISFENISFTYNKSNIVLNEFNLNISAGERFALVGKSGCGKTTLAYMLIGFYRPQQGEIIIDGQRLSDCSLKSIRQNIGLIAQDVLIFDGTIKENILLGNQTANEEEIEFACKQSGLWEYIETLPSGINTVIGSQGIGISGGQKQRIAIARIYLKNPKIIIFDEATSSLDSENEEAIHEAWKSVLIGRTSIVIAHRQSSVMFCKRAAILENGKICEVGTPAAMVSESHSFKTLFAVMEAH